MDNPNWSPDLFIGWHELHTDISLNFQLNRWAAFGGPQWLQDVRPILSKLENYEAWRSIFVSLGERAEAEGRIFHAALHFRSAEFFMSADDPRKDPLRRRLLPMLRAANGVPESSQREVLFRGMRLPVWQFTSEPSRRTAVIFGGFDSYIEDFFPVFTRMRREGWNVIAFEGPGQGSVLEEQHVPLTTDWHAPLGAILDDLGLDKVTLIGVSLGGCLAIRAAALEPRVHRVVAFDVLADLFQIMTKEHPLSVAVGLRGLIAIGARRLVDKSAATIAQHNLRLEWALDQALKVFGSATPTEALEATRKVQTRDVSAWVTQDVLLMAGTDDHYIPLGQLWEQARLLSSAHSITARVFTKAEQAQAHCQVGNLPLAIRVITAWADSLDGR